MVKCDAFMGEENMVMEGGRFENKFSALFIIENC